MNKWYKTDMFMFFMGCKNMTTISKVLDKDSVSFCNSMCSITLKKEKNAL